VHALLRHLEAADFDAAPRVVGTGFNPDGRETLTYVPGDFSGGRPPWTSPSAGPWSIEACAKLGMMVRRLHDAMSTFQPPAGASWFDWSGEEIGPGPRIISHRDLGPWNIVANGSLPVAFIDWDRAGPVAPLTELAHVCWMNARLYDDVVAATEGLPSPEERARCLRAIVDGYRLDRRGARAGLIDLIIEVAVHSVAEEADEFSVTADSTSQESPPELVWAMAWRGRSAAWIFKNRRRLEAAL
jgi:Ser/Thr protein kinase RdoA (MazF antagonist)